MKQKVGNISKILGKKSRTESIMVRFQKMAGKAKSPRELREIEMALLIPEPIPDYTGKKAIKNAFKLRTILFVFPDVKIIKRLKELFNVNTYAEQNTYDVDFIIELTALLESGRLEWDKKKKKYFLNLKTGRRLRI